jgi:hypothetical protein
VPATSAPSRGHKKGRGSGKGARGSSYRPHGRDYSSRGGEVHGRPESAVDDVEEHCSSEGACVLACPFVEVLRALQMMKAMYISTFQLPCGYACRSTCLRVPLKLHY